MNLRVVHVIQSDGFAGVERHVARLALAQASAGGEVVVIGGRADEMGMYARRGAAGGAGFVHHPGDTRVQTARSLWAATAGDAPTLIHAHMTVAESLAVLVAFRAVVPVVCTRHFARRRGGRRLSRWAVSGLGPRISAQIAISGYVADRIDGPSTVVLPGVPSQPDATSAQQRDRVVLVAQRLEAEKRTDHALEAFARSGLAALGWRLHIAGDGAERADLQRQAGLLGIGAATQFLGHRSDVDELMQRAAVLLAPCPVEGLGLTVLEAMAVGLPVVAAAAGGHLETVGAVAGSALFAPEDCDAAAAALRGLALDPDRRGALALDQQVVQRSRFTPDVQAAATEVVYRRVLVTRGWTDADGPVEGGPGD